MANDILLDPPAWQDKNIRAFVLFGGASLLLLALCALCTRRMCNIQVFACDMFLFMAMHWRMHIETREESIGIIKHV
jgi:hypothetical protein